MITIVRNFLHNSPDGGILPGPAVLTVAFDDFCAALPDIAASIEFAEDEIRGFVNYRTFLWCVAEFLKSSRPEDD